MTDGYANGPNFQKSKGQTIEIDSIPTGETVTFMAFLTDFQDSFASTWESEDVYGRMDPIQTFKGTTRTISLAWDLVASSHQEAKDNMKYCSKLFKMLYPTYEGTTMKASPLVRMKFANLITNAASTSTSASSAESGGLTGTIDGFTYAPDLEQGFFEEGAAVYPQTLALECTFIVAHTHDLGWKTEGGSRFPDAYPYNQASSATADDAPTAGGNTGVTGSETAPVASPERREEEASRGGRLGG